MRSTFRCWEWCVDDADYRALRKMERCARAELVLGRMLALETLGFPIMRSQNIIVELCSSAARCVGKLVEVYPVASLGRWAVLVSGRLFQVISSMAPCGFADV